MLKDKVVLITGANRGLGRVLANTLGAEGANLILCCRSTQKGLEIEKEMKPLGYNFKIFKLDLCDPENIYELGKELKSRYKHIDYLINNAGVFDHYADKDISSLSMDVLNSMFSTNLFGAVLLTKELLPLINLSVSGKIINITSDLTDINSMDGNFPAYRMSKGALNIFTANLGSLLSNTSTRVYGVDPGWMKTDMGGQDAPQTPEEVSEWIKWILLIKRDLPSGIIFYGKERASWWKNQDTRVDDNLILALIEDSYNLKLNNNIRKLGRWGDSIRWVIDGENKKFFLKEKPYYLDDTEYSFHRKLQSYLYNNGGPVVNIHSTVDQNLELKTESAKVYELQEWIEGRTLSSNSLEDLEDMGVSLSEFSLLSEGFYSHYENDWTSPKCRSIYFPTKRSDYIKKMDVIKNNLEKVNTINSRQFEYILSWINNAFAKVNWRELPQSYIHGDAHLYNCIRNNENKVLLVDLDDARWDYRITDLAWCCSISGCIKWDKEYSVPRINSRINVKNIQHIIRGYSKNIKLTTPEIQFFPFVLGLNLILSFINCLGLDDGELPFDFNEQVNILSHMLKDINSLILDYSQNKKTNLTYMK
ncbi:SDR family NAD(P)-dependent oxidoreductase [Virgibacillus pantothenticus]|uniref:SDR family NAD(P)-dependent oxidoreductase n=1 Tax=Virgibacillus pantothenticus TaxID=1473 RepID=UPI0009869EE7|nr:SDR family NAD(P)-dependent oxidoreductase [Virgibacillus pantothenticus]